MKKRFASYRLRGGAATIRRNILLPVILVVLVALTKLAAQAATWVQVWSDEFNGASISGSNWTYDIGGGGWGNNELEFYTDRPENSYISNGMLVIEARKEKF